MVISAAQSKKEKRKKDKSSASPYHSMGYNDNDNDHGNSDANTDASHPHTSTHSYRRESEAHSVLDLPSADLLMPEHTQTIVRSGLLRASLFAQVLLMILTFVSVIIATLPYYSYDTLTLRDTHTFIWMDFFITYLFFCDLVMRYFLRDKEKVPTAWVFLKRNWTDGLALFTDIPVRGASLSSLKKA